MALFIILGLSHDMEYWAFFFLDGSGIRLTTQLSKHYYEINIFQIG